VIQLIPQHGELSPPVLPATLSESMRKRIELEAKNNSALEESLKNVVEKLLTRIETTPHLRNRS